MATRHVTVELPDELLSILGSADAAASKMRESVVMELLRRAEITQGQAAALLNISRWDLLDLMVPYQIPSGATSLEELRQDIEEARRNLEAAHVHAGHQ